MTSAKYIGKNDDGVEIVAGDLGENVVVDFVTNAKENAEDTGDVENNDVEKITDANMNCMEEDIKDIKYIKYCRLC